MRLNFRVTREGSVGGGSMPFGIRTAQLACSMTVGTWRGMTLVHDGALRRAHAEHTRR